MKDEPRLKEVIIELDTPHLPQKAKDFILFLEAQISLHVPEEYIDQAEIDIEHEEDYGGCTNISICISYERPETHQEMIIRIIEEEARKRREVDRLERRLNKLVGKF